MSYEFFIGRRYLLSRKSNRLISVITVISVLGVALGVMALTVVVSIMSGWTDYFQEKILGNNAHIIVQRLGRDIEEYGEVVKNASGIKGVSGATPFIYEEVLVTNAGQRSAGVVIYGVDPKTFGRASKIPSDMLSGSIEDLVLTEDGKPRRGNKLPGLIVGKELAENELFLFPGSVVTVISPMGELSPFGMGPKMRNFEVVGIFQTGLYEFDSKYIYTDLKTLQDFLMIGDVAATVQVRIEDLKNTDRYAGKVQTAVGDEYIVRTWKDLNRDIFAAFKLEKTAFFIILTMIVLVASFNIVGTLNMTVMEKAKEISILKSLGATSRGIMRIFVTFGFLIGVVGTVVGVCLGYVICVLLKDYLEFPLNPSVYQISHLPVKMQAMDFAVVAFCALTISFLATIYPALKAASVDPCEGIRYE